MKLNTIISIAVGVAIGIPLSVYADSTRIYGDGLLEKPAPEIHTVQLEDIAGEDRQAELELLACVVHAEAGNQDLHGKRLVADVVFNRVMSDRFPNTITEVIYQPGQFSVVNDGALERAYTEVTEEDFQAVEMEIDEELDYEVLFFTAGGYNPYCVPMYQYGDHYFGR